MTVHLLEANALFVHIPKTGGSWVEEVLPAIGIETASPPAADGVFARHALPDDVLGRFDFSFTFVRHPVRWYESWWNYQVGAWHQFDPALFHPPQHLAACAAGDFSTFIRNCIEREPAYVTRMYEWYIGPPARARVDFVGLHEDLADSLVSLLRSLAYDFDEAALRAHPRVNVSKMRNGPAVWEPALRERIEALETPAINRFYRP